MKTLFKFNQIKKIIFIVIAPLVLAMIGQSLAEETSVSGKVTKINNNNITIETIHADTISEGSKVELFFKPSENMSISIGTWKVSGSGKGVIYAIPVDEIAPPKVGMTAEISPIPKKSTPVIVSNSVKKNIQKDISEDNSSYDAIIPQLRGKGPGEQLLGELSYDKSAEEYAGDGDTYLEQKNYKKAAIEYEQCAKMGHAGCQRQLGFLYSQGLGVTKNATKAVALYKRSAEQNDATAIYNLGVNYARGQGVEKDGKRAHELFKKSANMGNSDAQFNLGVTYFQGIGVEKDITTAFKWINKAAQTNPKAMYVLAQAHEFGWGIPKNMVKATKWYKKAADAGNQDAVKRMYKTDKQ